MSQAPQPTLDVKALESIQRVMPAGFGVYDLREQRLVCETGWLRRILGYPAEDFGEKTGDFFAPLLANPKEDAPRIRAHVKRLLSDRESGVYENEYRVLAHDGSEQVIRCRDTVFLRDENGNATHSFGVLCDVTRADRLSQNLLEAERMLFEVRHFHASELENFCDRILGLLDEMEADDSSELFLLIAAEALHAIVQRLAECVEIGVGRIENSVGPDR